LRNENLGRIAGQVVDERNEPIQGSNVKIIGTSIGGPADRSGHYCIKNIPPGIYNLVAYTVWYNRTFAERLLVVADSISIQDFKLTSDTLNIKDNTIPAQRQVVSDYPPCDQQEF
jgi:hypothetical protein